MAICSQPEAITGAMGLSVDRCQDYVMQKAVREIEAMSQDYTEVLSFWFEEIGPKGWFFGGEEVDNKVRTRFKSLWEDATRLKLAHWAEDARGALALVILLDQFPRNMFRGSGQSFASDALALSTAEQAIARGFDLELPEPDRVFLYVPHMHSEDLEVQDRCVALVRERIKGNAENALHARAHRMVIQKFGRFPYRNEALGREMTADEERWLADVGYAGTVAQLREKT